MPYNVGINENAARTLEYAYDDWCIYQLGKALKKPKKEIEIFAKRAMNYKNLYDPEHKLMRGKNEDGTFQSPFNPLKWGDAFTEGNSWHYTWSVFHDPQGLIDLMGAGVKIYLYQKGFLHSKLIVSDDTLSTVGSTNMDFRSFEHNFEVNAFMYDRTSALILKEIFLKDQKDAFLLQRKQWIKRPWYQKVQESTIRLLAPLL